jgi:hypothetical protein
MPTRIERHLGELTRAPRIARRGALTAIAQAAAPPQAPPPEFTWRDYAVFLLTIAAQIEHSLMVQYLYASYSLGGPRWRPSGAPRNRSAFWTVARCPISSLAIPRMTCRQAETSSRRTCGTCETLVVDPAGGAVVDAYKPREIRFRDEAGRIRPVAPFFQIYARTSQDVLEPLTFRLLKPKALFRAARGAAGQSAFAGELRTRRAPTHGPAGGVAA